MLILNKFEGGNLLRLILAKVRQTLHDKLSKKKVRRTDPILPTAATVSQEVLKAHNAHYNGVIYA